MNDKMFSELFGGAEKFKALRHLFEHSTQAFSSRELAAGARTDPGNTHRWLKRWHEAGLVSQSGTRQSQFLVSRDPALAPLLALFRQSSQLVQDLVDALGPLEAVECAVVFGSFARHEEGADSDIDVLVLGDVSELKANALLRPLARRYGREFNASVFGIPRFMELLAEGDDFAQGVVSNPTLALKGDLHEQVA